MKIAVVGTRTLNDYTLFKSILNPICLEVMNRKEHLVFISGGATGADQLAERYAKENGIPIIIHLPQWNIYGKAAGPIRNKLIIDDADFVVAFWDFQSKGTKSSIDLAKKSNKPIEIVDIRTSR